MAVTNTYVNSVFTTPGNGTFVVPVGVYQINAMAWAGGGGSNNSSERNCGGGGGSFASRPLAVNPGDFIYYWIGKGGYGYYNAGGTPIDGESSAIRTTFQFSSAPSSSSSISIYADSGKSGASAGTGGSSSSSNGAVKFSGGKGANVATCGGGGAGSQGTGRSANSTTAGAGGSPDGGNGGSGSNGSMPGGGGGGGFDGANGQVLFQYKIGVIDFPISNTFTVPSGVSHIMIQCWGAGGGGNSTASAAGGDFAQINALAVSPGDTIYVNVGLGGNGLNYSFSNGSNGQATWAGKNSNVPSNAVVAAVGGYSAVYSYPGTSYPGPYASNGDLIYLGGAGGNAFGGGGGAGSGGPGGTSSNNSGGVAGTPDGARGGTYDYFGLNDSYGHTPGGGGGSITYQNGWTGGGNGFARILFSISTGSLPIHPIPFA